MFIRVHPWPFMSSPMPRPHTLFTAFALASLALFWMPLHQLVSLSLDDQRYSHLILIPVISVFFMYRERHQIFSRIDRKSVV